MKISGFTFLRNADSLRYPYLESIRSVLDIVDEFVIALASSSEGDRTLEGILSLSSTKIKIIQTEWDTVKYHSGSVYAQQTDLAKSHCTGDWLMYLQADEVLHEDDTPLIRKACEKYFHDDRVEGFLCTYLHFWGDYDHYLPFHGWYGREIRIIRNRPDIHSFADAQSFRSMPDFDGESYFKAEGTRMLNVIKIPIRVFHYGWVRHPKFMATKNRTTSEHYYRHSNNIANEFDYGNMSRIPRYRGTHPKVMVKAIDSFDWESSLRYTDDPVTNRGVMKHEKKLYRVITTIEKILFGGIQKFGYSNWKIIGKFNA